MRVGGVRVLSLGWGVQSWTLAAMSALGELDVLDAAVHSDTRYERAATYAFAEKWTPWLLDSVGVLAVETVYAGQRASAVTHVLPSGRNAVHIPAFSAGPKDGQTKRECTQEWKLRPFRTWVRTWLPKGEVAEVWLGISADEFQRARDADVQYVRNRFPLLELGMTREDCKKWLAAHDLEIPPKSACTFCPYQSRPAWAALKRAGGADWDQAVEVDALIRDKRPPYRLYLHSARRPLAEAVDIPEDHGYTQTGFDPEGRCDEGMCWV